MLLTEDGASILPEWAFCVKCFFNTDKLRPTASREDFYKNELLSEAREEISQCISSYLERLSIRNPSLLDKIVSLHGTALKSIASENDRLFDIFMPYFTFETSLGVLSALCCPIIRIRFSIRQILILSVSSDLYLLKIRALHFYVNTL